MSVRARAWIALLLPPLSWFAFEQGLSALLHARCDRPSTGVAWGLASLVACGLSLRLGATLRRAGAGVDSWLATLALAVAGFFALAIAFQTLALMMVPPCLG